MYTYQDLAAVGDNEKKRIEFALAAIESYKAGDFYKTAVDAEMYYKHLNPTIMKAQKMVYNLMGQAVPDIWRANNKIPCRYFFYFVTQSVQFLLGNGVSFSDDATKERLGKTFDASVQNMATNAVISGVSYGFWNFDHLDVFKATEFVPLEDEENGALRAGIRFWRLSDNKPLRFTLYEEDGYTEYIQRNEKEPEVLIPKKSYIQIVEKSPATGTTIYDGGNYPGFPIVPMFNTNKQSEIVGNRETIDAYDLMASALINNIDDANIIYWVIRNAGGMNDIDDQKFIQRLKTLNVIHLENEEEVDAHQVEVPFEASETALERLRGQLFDDFMALDVKQIAGGAATATQIKAAYEPLNSKTDLFEYQVTEFIHGVLSLIGIDDMPTYTRSLIANQQEVIQNLVYAAEYLSQEYVTRKLLETFGDIDKADEVLEQMLVGEASRFGSIEQVQE